MNFLYPKSKHQRTQSPPAYSDYRKFKPHLRVEFSHLCVYCRVSEKTRFAYDEYAVEHYRPKSDPRFAHLECDYTNLFYACPACNRRKWKYWPAAGKEQTEFIPNPCDHEMFSHIAYRGAEVVPKTEAGRKACELLRLNEAKFVEWRKGILKLVDAAEALAARFEHQCSEAKAANAPAEEIARIQASLDEATAALNLVRG